MSMPVLFKSIEDSLPIRPIIFHSTLSFSVIFVTTATDYSPSLNTEKKSSATFLHSPGFANQPLLLFIKTGRTMRNNASIQLVYQIMLALPLYF
ncbi:MAG TPA: hypothetical protein DD422_01655 [Akkermansia sp.]|uniref:hypothetical protein n=2 Tax=Akkermansia TaxID=239934 RepID=UPI000E93D5FB|nr:hypothetical protein [uncultured Akkermansia sp.]HBN16737.1 hypothetical protein [Akkermansia sp.]